MRGFQPANKKPTKGGPVRGPGTGTSDEVADTVADGTYIMPTDSTEAIGEQNLAAMGKGAPVDVQLSNGEFKMPPEQVHAVGVQALDQMKDATHTPVAARGFAPGAQQQAEPPLFFVNGGEVDKDKLKGPSPTNIFPGNRLPGDSGATSAASPTPAVPVTQPAAPKSAPAPAGPTSTYFDEGAADVAKRWESGSVPGALGAAVRTGVGTVGMAGVEALDNTVGAAGRGIGRTAVGFWDGLVGNEPVKTAASQPSGQAAAAPAASASTAVTPAAQKMTAAPVDGGRGTINPPLVNPNAPAPTSSTASPTEIAPGVFRSGNSYSDSAAGALGGEQPRGFSVAGQQSPVGMSVAQAQQQGLVGGRIGYNPAFDQRLSGGPSPQNMAAADALAQRSQQESMARVTAAQPVEHGWSGVIGSDPGMSVAGRERRDLVSALTTPLKGAQNGQLTAAQRAGMLSLLDQEARGFQAKANNATALQQTEMQTDAQRDMTAMREAGDSSRAVLREAGETGRAGARNAIDQSRLGLEQQVRGFDIRAGQRQEKLYERYAAADTQEKKSAIAQEIRDLSGKQAESPWRIQVTPATKNADGSTSEGSIYRYNTQTAQVERVDTGKPQLPLDQNPQAAAIKANTALSREQKAAELRKLGY